MIWDSVYIGPNVGVRSGYLLCSRATVKRVDWSSANDAVIGDRCLVDVGCHDSSAGSNCGRTRSWSVDLTTVTMSLVWGSRWRKVTYSMTWALPDSGNIEITLDFACRLGSAFGSCFPQGCWGS